MLEPKIEELADEIRLLNATISTWITIMPGRSDEEVAAQIQPAIPAAASTVAPTPAPVASAKPLPDFLKNLPKASGWGDLKVQF